VQQEQEQILGVQLFSKISVNEITEMAAAN